MKLVLIAIAVVAVAFAGIAIKILAKKNGQFAGTCASNNPMFNKDGKPCSVCGARPDEQCLNEETVG
jgi:hypothetical protein